MVFAFLFVLLLVIHGVVMQETCECKNNGICNLNGSCSCSPGYYGITCSNYAFTYKVQYFSTPTDVQRVLNELKVKLANYSIADAIRIDPGNIVKLVFYEVISDKDLENIRKTSEIGGKIEAISDYNECTEGKQSCYSDTECTNTIGSFQCIQSEKNNPLIYLWIGAVCAIFILMISFIVCIRLRKKKKMKKEEAKRAQQLERKIRSNSALAAVNIHAAASPALRKGPGSVFGESITSNRPLSLNGVNADASSIYSYNSRNFVGLDSDQNRYRLSIPVLDSYPSSYSNFGYDRTSSVSRMSSGDAISYRLSNNEINPYLSQSAEIANSTERREQTNIYP